MIEPQAAPLVEELRRALRGFEAIVGSLSDAVTIRDRSDRLLYANEAALAYMGFSSLEELQRTPPEEIMADYVVSGATGQPIAMHDIPSVRILRGEGAGPLLIRTVQRRTGEQRWALLKAAPLRDEERRLEATIMVIQDVTQVKRAELGASFLARAGFVLASSVDYEQTLRQVAELAVQVLADWCVIDVLDDAGRPVRLAVAHADPAGAPVAGQLRALEPERANPARGSGWVLHTGEPLLVPDVREPALAGVAQGDPHLALLRSVGLRSVLGAPLRGGERVLGTIMLASAESERVLDQVDLELAEQIASRAAVAIEHGRLYRERSLIAQTLQQSLLPETLPQIPGYELASLYLPVAPSSLVGGDFYDAWKVGGAWMLAIGDVAGKGIAAATLTARVRHTLRAASEFQRSPAALLELVDRTLRRRSTMSLCTALCMRLDGDRVTLAVGGHPLPLHLSGGGAVEEVGRPGPLLGAFANAAWHDVSVRLEQGGTLLAYTDGVTDARGGGGRLGLAGLRSALSPPAASAGELIDHLHRRLIEFQVGRAADDVAALALRRSG
ncbi:MAG TPA: SpoIIE family protein phosphatase [Solirubrobacteraceae bacterium]|jgi:PAS domain S-box-containing protein|nr:SpoIIE family protein phosphatase [Solirubrobacteraceae bacterium]